MSQKLSNEVERHGKANKSTRAREREWGGVHDKEGGEKGKEDEGGREGRNEIKGRKVRGRQNVER